MKKLPEGDSRHLVETLRLLVDEKEFMVECDRATFSTIIGCAEASHGEIEPWLYDAIAPLRFVRTLRFLPFGRVIFPASLAQLELDVDIDLENETKRPYGHGALDLVAGGENPADNLRHLVGSATMLAYGSVQLGKRESRLDPEAFCVESVEMDRSVAGIIENLDETLGKLCQMTKRKRYVQPIRLPGMPEGAVESYKDLLYNLELAHYCALIVTGP